MGTGASLFESQLQGSWQLTSDKCSSNMSRKDTRRVIRLRVRCQRGEQIY